MSTQIDAPNSETPWLPKRPRDRWLALAGLLALLGGLAAYGPKAVEESRTADFERYYNAGLAAARGDSPYDIPVDPATGTRRDDLEFKYFPCLAQGMSPLATFSEWCATGTARPDLPTLGGLTVGAAIWYALLCLCYLASLAMAVDLCRPKHFGETLCIGGGALLLSARFFVANVRNGQINMVAMLFAVLAAWIFLRGARAALPHGPTDRARWSTALAAGIAAALGALVKFMPAGLLLWFLRRRSWLAGAGFLATVAATMILLPSLHWPGGPRAGVWRYQDYVERRKQMITDLPDSEAAGQSLPSMINRLLRPANAAPVRGWYRHGAFTRDPLTINVADWSETAANRAALAAVLLTSLLYVLLLRGRLEDAAGLRGALEAGALFLLLLLISPEARKAHFVTLLVPGAALTAMALRAPALGMPALRRVAVLGMGLPLATLWLGAREVVGKENEWYYYLNAYGIVLWAAVLLFAVSLYLLQRLPRGGSPEPGAPDMPSAPEATPHQPPPTPPAP